jgi:hypothetical protein
LAGQLARAEEMLTGCYYLAPGWVHPRFAGGALAPLVHYLAMRDARRMGRSMLVSDVTGGSRSSAGALALASVLGPEATQDRNAATRGGGEARVPAWQVHRAAFHLFASMSPTAQAFVAEHLLVDELEGTVRDRAALFYTTSFFQRIFERTLTRTQYLESVANNHQFVRWTTRLLGRMVGVTADPVLRRHYVEHLKGEIDHEVLLENDLRYLGADVEYVKKQMVPCREIQQFMVVQESLAAFHADPVQFLAVPFAIEAGTAFMDARFIESLRACIASWGYSTPGRGCTFLTSHINTDGGDDGHWEATRKVLRLFMRDEYTMQRALNTAHLVMDGVSRAYEAYGQRPAVERFALPTD